MLMGWLKGLPRPGGMSRGRILAGMVQIVSPPFSPATDRSRECVKLPGPSRIFRWAKLTPSAISKLQPGYSAADLAAERDAAPSIPATTAAASRSTSRRECRALNASRRNPVDAPPG